VFSGWARLVLVGTEHFCCSVCDNSVQHCTLSLPSSSSPTRMRYMYIAVVGHIGYPWSWCKEQFEIEPWPEQRGGTVAYLWQSHDRHQESIVSERPTSHDIVEQRCTKPQQAGYALIWITLRDSSHRKLHKCATTTVATAREGVGHDVPITSRTCIHSHKPVSHKGRI